MKPTPLPNKHSSSSTPEQPVTRWTYLALPGVAPTQARLGSCGHGWPPHTEKPSPLTATGSRACTPSTKPPNCYPTTQRVTSGLMSHSIPFTSPAGVVTHSPTSETPRRSASLPPHLTSSTHRSSAPKQRFTLTLRPPSQPPAIERKRGTTLIMQLGSPHRSAQPVSAVAWQPI